MIECVMLDVDGVVVNGRPADGLSWASDIQGDLGVDPEQLQQHFFAPHWSDIVTGRKPLKQTLEACLPTLANGVSAADFIAYWFALDSRIDDDLLAECRLLRDRGVKVFLASNQEPLRAAYLMERLGLRAHVDGMICSAEIGACKPEPAFYDAATARSGAAPGAILLVDDDQANIDGALAAGWRAARWSAGASLTQLASQPPG